MLNFRKLFITIVFLITLLIVAACGVFSKRPDWLNNWLQNPTCQPPCWEDIIPAQTTYDQAIDILSQNPSVFDIYSEDIIPLGQSLTWYIGNKPGEGYGIMVFDANRIVQQVNLTVENEGLYLENISSIYGPPESVIFRDWVSGPGYVSVDLLYPKLGMAIGLYLDNLATDWNDTKVNVKCNSGVWYIRFFDPDLRHYYMYLEIIDPLKQYNWKGCTTYP